MKLLNYTTRYFALVLIFIISIWALIFYWSMLDEIYDSLDDGLENQKLLVIYHASKDSSVLARSDFADGYYRVKKIDYEDFKYFKDIYKDTLMYTEYENDLEPMRMLRTVFKQGENYYNLNLITSMVEEDDQIENLLFFLLVLYVVLVATILYLNNKMTKKLWRPFYSLLKEIKTFDLNNPQQIKYKNSKIDEFNLLNSNVEKLLQNNIDAYNSQKVFIENAAHELQTPLAVSINKLELMPDYEKLTPAQAVNIEAAITSLERLKRLNNALLLISRIENRQFANEIRISINNIVLKILHELHDLKEYNEVEVNIFHEEQPSIFMNNDLALILFTNLLKNAILHSKPEGKVNIYITRDEVKIINSGMKNTVDKEKLFHRFYKSSGSGSSTGLGLAIVKAIVDLYGFSINYTYSEGHTFRLKFK